ncbi:MAG: hypothetical protein ACXV47_09130 [Halobacteriota archaeon]
MARFNITLPDPLRAQLEAEAQRSSTKISTLVARLIKDHFDSASKDEYELQIEQLQQKNQNIERQAQTEINELLRQQEQERAKATQAAAAQVEKLEELQDELEGEKERTKSLEQDIVNKDDRIQLLEQDLAAAQEAIGQLGQETRELQAKLKAEGENCQQGLTEQEHRHQDTITEEERRHKDITNALRHEQELTQNNLKKAEEQVVELKGQIHGLNEDKQYLQKQLELVTLRLPAPKEGFWSGVFGR